ncbi:MAG: phosphate acyltransferase [Thiotrichales bacterium]|nr:MAG: phosphate acyltransferase [Thiotrichales bacterium]
MKRIAIDAMGGDHGVKEVVLACVLALKKYRNLYLVLVGDQEQIESQLKLHKSSDHPRISIRHTSETVAMDESPSKALRNKKDSSMRVAVNLVKDKTVGACVSAGNTGALMATSRFVLKMIPGIDRPAIVYPIPVFKQNNKVLPKPKTVYMLDLGANIDCNSQHLFQFAIMGSILAEAVSNITSPRVALLNIGEEEIKGLDYIKQAAKLLSECKDINYTGYIEGNKIYNYEADVVVCDGFVGNIALKIAEGLVSTAATLIRGAFTKNWFTKLCAIFSLPVLKSMKRTFNPKKYNGATFLGLRGIVVKSHGSAKAEAFVSAIKAAMYEIEKDVPNLIQNKITNLLENHQRDAS